jgi:hypothetical protein
MKPEEFFCPWIQCRITLRKPSEFLIKRDKVRIEVLDCRRRGNDSITQEPSKTGTDFRGKVEVDQDHRPSRVLAPVEDGTPVEGEAQGHIATIRKVLVLQILAINYHVLITEVLVDGTIKDVANGVVVMLVCCVIVPVPHEFCDRFVSEHRVEQRFDCQVLELFFRDTGTVESRLIAVGTGIQILELPRKTAAPFLAAIDRAWFHTGQRSDPFLGSVKGVEIPQFVGERIA